MRLFRLNLVECRTEGALGFNLREMSLTRLSLGNVKVSELGTGGGQKVLKFRIGDHEVVQCRSCPIFARERQEVAILKSTT